MDVHRHPNISKDMRHLAKARGGVIITNSIGDLERPVWWQTGRAKLTLPQAAAAASSSAEHEDRVGLFTRLSCRCCRI